MKILTSQDEPQKELWKILKSQQEGYFVVMQKTKAVILQEIARGIQKLEMSDPLRRDIEKVFNKLENGR